MLTIGLGTLARRLQVEPETKGNMNMSSISATADHVAGGAKHAALAARVSLIELGSQALRFVNNMREREPNGLLFAHLGRRREPSRITPVLWFAAGAAAAGGVALLLGSRGKGIQGRPGRIVGAAEEKIASRDRAAEDAMTNEGGTSMPQSESNQAAH
jgi:hypothetical protein